MGKQVTTKTDEKVWRAFYHLADNPDFQVIAAWLKETKDSCFDKFLKAETDRDLNIMQGRSQMITEILNEKESALENLNKNRNP